MGILSILCIEGIITFIRSIGKNYWWRWIYIFGGGYVLFDLFAIAMKLKAWNKLVLLMFDTSSAYWNPLWSIFILIGSLLCGLGLYLLRKMKQ